MHTMVIVVMLLATGENGGATSSITTLDFQTKAECETAAVYLRERGPLVERGEYRIKAKCVARAQ